MLTLKEEKIARELYHDWFERYPEISNPTDMNLLEKYVFAIELGFNKYRLMQRARKSNVKKYKYPYPWTKPEYWKELNELSK